MVADGEHLSCIAEENGFGSFERIFDAEENSELKEIRPNAHQLVVGDIFILPDKQVEVRAAPLDQTTLISIKKQELFVRLKVLDYLGEPIANEAGVLRLRTKELPVTTDADGFFQVAVPRSTRRAELTIAGLTFQLRVGALQPSSEVEGVRARLMNLGCWAGQSEPEDIGNEGEFSLGIELFQEDAGLPVDGKISDDLATKLVESHGQ
jgi:hypothetical protein